MVFRVILTTTRLSLRLVRSTNSSSAVSVRSIQPGDTSDSYVTGSYLWL